MKVTHVSIKPTDAANLAGCNALTPEMLASVAARYSRSNEGVDSILEKVSHLDQDKAIDQIFHWLDYGHSSIAGMTPIAMFLDEISIMACFHIFNWCPLGAGQENSTRYLKFDSSSLIDPNILGIPESDQKNWESIMNKAFSTYNAAIQYWQKYALEYAEVLGLSEEILESTKDKDIKFVDRIRRNFYFDRARYYIPCAAKTGMMLIQNAQEWAKLVSKLLSAPYAEFRTLGIQIQEALALSAPRLIKHSKPTDALITGLREEMNIAGAAMENLLPLLPSMQEENKTLLRFDHQLPIGSFDASLFGESLRHRKNRYDYIDTNLQRTTVQAFWPAVAIAEARDMNRHRPGNRWIGMAPMGFYGAEDQTEDDISVLRSVGVASLTKMRQLLRQGDPSYLYWALLGTQIMFEHTLPADKFIYMCELRTGPGTHFRYRKHYQEALEEWYNLFPKMCYPILEGTGEPE